MNIHEILKKHQLWLIRDPQGTHANLSAANLSDANLSAANLSAANLRAANLRAANLRAADLSDADLSAANLSAANLSDANLSAANLRAANLRAADLNDANLSAANLSAANLSAANLRAANLRAADLSDADLSDAILPHFQICPEEGEFIGWKKVNSTILKLKIPADAQRTSTLVGRKCRASYVVTIEAFPTDPEVTPIHKFTGIHNINTIYEIGKPTYPDSYNDDIRIECTHGIHFFITRKEAEEY